MRHRIDCRNNANCTKKTCRRDCSTIDIDKELNKKLWDDWNKEQNPDLTKKRYRHPLKPWDDEESLFCDTEFLKKFTGKIPLSGDECKDEP